MADVFQLIENDDEFFQRFARGFRAGNSLVLECKLQPDVAWLADDIQACVSTRQRKFDDVAFLIQGKNNLKRVLDTPPRLVFRSFGRVPPGKLTTWWPCSVDSPDFSIVNTDSGKLLASSRFDKGRCQQTVYLYQACFDVFPTLGREDVQKALDTELLLFPVDVELSGESPTRGPGRQPRPRRA